MTKLTDYRQRVEDALTQAVSQLQQVPDALKKAMGYSLLASGKRLRPVLLLTSASVIGGNMVLEKAVPFALAIEMIHTYSLIHDDLPAMDNDQLRRGKPTSHVVFGEAMAILAGDGLLSWAMETMTSAALQDGRPACLEAMGAIARGCGIHGMVAGQVLDMEGESQSPTLPMLQAIHQNKTGALIRAAAEAGAWLGGGTAVQVQAMAAYGSELGLAFQLLDDLLDTTSTPEQLGKSTGKDQAAHKMTWIALRGMDGTRQDAEAAIQRSLDALSIFDEKADLLRSMAKDSLNRDR